MKRKGYYFQISSLEFFTMFSGMLNVTSLILFFRPQCYGSHCCGCGCGCATQPPPPHSTPHSYHHHDHFSSVPPNNQHYINNSNDEVQQQQTVRGSNPELYQIFFTWHFKKFKQIEINFGQNCLIECCQNCSINCERMLIHTLANNS